MILASVLLCSSESVSGDEPAQIDFERQVRPILQARCYRCHGPKKQNARIRLDTLSTDMAASRPAAETWHEILNTLNAAEMPPEDEPQLSRKERETLTRWISSALDEAAALHRSTDGRVVLRRLNGREYQNTMTDLLGLEMDYIRDLPPDAPSSDGFRNNGRALRISALQLEYYLQTARSALKRVIVRGPAPQVYSHSFNKSNVGNFFKQEMSNTLGRSQTFLVKMVDDYPETGRFRIRVRTSARIPEGSSSPILQLEVGYRPDTEVLFRVHSVVEVDEEAANTYEFEGRIENYPLPVRGQGKFPGLMIRICNIYDDGSEHPKQVEVEENGKKRKQFPSEPHLPELIIESVSFEGPYFDEWPPASHRRILYDSPLRESDESAYAAEVIQKFMLRAWRRPVMDAEVASIVDFYESVRPDSPSFEDAMIESLTLVLISPEFLFLTEPASERRQLTDFELASRLSYFLWSTMPDQRLLTLAADGTLKDEQSLKAEINRMLADPRSEQFTERFVTEWLKLDTLDPIAVDRDYYPDFDDSLRAEMKREPQEFFRYLLNNDLSAHQLLDSSFVVVNERLARHYGIPDIQGMKFRRVELDRDLHRGGLLAQAAILTANSTGRDSHAIRRAVWIRDNLLDDPPAPPPPDVPDLDEADPRFASLSVREQLKVHRDSASCNSCHRSIDPWGVALENFDAVGRWRTEIRRKERKKFVSLPVESSDRLPDGTEFSGFTSLKKHLVEHRQDQFSRAIVKRLLTYALGRSLELSDEPLIDDLRNEFESDGLVLRQLIHSIVLSKAFQTK